MSYFELISNEINLETLSEKEILKLKPNNIINSNSIYDYFFKDYDINNYNECQKDKVTKDFQLWNFEIYRKIKKYSELWKEYLLIFDDNYLNKIPNFNFAQKNQYASLIKCDTLFKILIFGSLTKPLFENFEFFIRKLDDDFLQNFLFDFLDEKNINEDYFKKDIFVNENINFNYFPSENNRNIMDVWNETLGIISKFYPSYFEKFSKLNFFTSENKINPSYNYLLIIKELAKLILQETKNIINLKLDKSRNFLNELNDLNIFLSNNLIENSDNLEKYYIEIDMNETKEKNVQINLFSKEDNKIICFAKYKIDCIQLEYNSHQIFRLSKIHYIVDCSLETKVLFNSKLPEIIDSHINFLESSSKNFF